MAIHSTLKSTLLCKEPTGHKCSFQEGTEMPLIYRKWPWVAQLGTSATGQKPKWRGGVSRACSPIERELRDRKSQVLS